MTKKMTKKKVEKKSAWTKVEPIHLDWKKKYVVQRAVAGCDPELLVVGYDVDDVWSVQAGAGVDINLCDIIAYIELPE